MLGYCQCKNLRINWKIKDFSLVPRACQCPNCIEKDAIWLCKSGSTFELSVRFNEFYKQIIGNDHSATQHLCSNCNTLVAITTFCEEIQHGAVNTNVLIKKDVFAKPIKVDQYCQLNSNEDSNFWHKNWCAPVSIIRPATKLQIIKT